MEKQEGIFHVWHILLLTKEHPSNPEHWSIKNKLKIEDNTIQNTLILFAVVRHDCKWIWQKNINIGVELFVQHRTVRKLERINF